MKTLLTHNQYLWINIAIVIVLLYFFLLVINLVMIAFFKKSLKKHRHGMSLAAYTKFDNILRLIEILKKYNVEIEQSYLDMANSMNNSSFKHPERPEGKQAIDNLTFLRETIMSVARRETLLNKNAEFQEAISHVLEMDTVYRTATANYNADVLGYNYWVRFLPFRYLFLLFKIKTKDLI